MESNLLLAVKDSTVTAMEIPPAKLAAEASERKVRADTKGDIREAKADPPPRRRVRTYQRHREQTSVYNPYKLFGYTPY
jgi:hypothetical protein